MAEIATIAATVAGITVTVGATTVPAAKKWGELPVVLADADLPLRLMLWNDDRGAGADGPAYLVPGATGVLSKLRWRLVDMMLWRPSSLGLGPFEYAANLMTYVEEYAKKLQDIRQTSTNSFISANPPPRPVIGEFAWPRSAGPGQTQYWYAGVAWHIEIEHFLT